MILKILFMGSPEISVPFLELIYEKKCEILVFSQKDKVRKRGKKLVPTPVKSKALELNIPVHTALAKSKQAYDIISDFSPDIIFVVAYGQILPDRILNSVKLYPLNVHFSLLPKYRGATPVNTALLNGDKITGTTLMVMDRELDTGDIVYQEECSIIEDDNATSLFERLINVSMGMIRNNWDDITTGKITRTPQPDGATYTKLIEKSDLLLDLNSDAENIFNRVRAFTFEPGVKTSFRGKPLFIEKAELVADTSGEPGTVAEVGKNFLNVYCGKGSLRISQVKPAGKRSMKAKEFINGYKPQIGEVLG